MPTSPDDVAKAAKERLRSPIAGVYSIVWSIYHWPVLVMLVSSVSSGNGVSEASAKIDAIRSYFAVLHCRDIFLGPTLVTVILIMSMFVLHHLHFRAAQWFDLAKERKLILDKQRLAFETTYHSDLVLLLGALAKNAESAGLTIASHVTDCRQPLEAYSRNRDAELLALAMNLLKKIKEQADDLLANTKELAEKGLLQGGSGVSEVANSIERKKRGYYSLSLYRRTVIALRMAVGIHDPKGEDAKVIALVD